MEYRLNDLLIIIVKTYTPCHLFLYYGKEKPRPYTLYRTVRGEEVPCISSYAMPSAGFIEEYYAGDNYIHLFFWPDWKPGVAWGFYFKGTIDGNPTRSTSPPFYERWPCRTYKQLQNLLGNLGWETGIPSGWNFAPVNPPDTTAISTLQPYRGQYHLRISSRAAPSNQYAYYQLAQLFTVPGDPVIFISRFKWAAAGGAAQPANCRMSIESIFDNYFLNLLNYNPTVAGPYILAVLPAVLTSAPIFLRFRFRIESNMSFQGVTFYFDEHVAFNVTHQFLPTRTAVPDLYQPGVLW